MMIQKKNRFWLALVVTSVLALGEAFGASQQVGSAVSTLTQRYDSLIRVPDNDPIVGGDLQIHCLSLVFQNWSRAYLDVLDRTAIDPQAVGKPLINFGHKWFSAEDNLKVAEYFRPGVTEVLRSVLNEIRVSRGGPADLDPAKINLADILDPLYFSNLKICLSPEIIEKAKPLVREVDPTTPIPNGLIRNPYGSVTWAKSEKGGIKPIWSEPNPNSSSGLIPLVHENSSITYRDYLNLIQSR